MVPADLLFAQSIPSFPAHAIHTSIAIDGNLDENVWREAEVVSGLRQFEPDEGAEASQKTEIRVLYDDNNLYIGAILHDYPSAIEQTLGHRDDYNRADWFRVSIDSYLNRKTAYTFGVSAAGVQFDAIRTNEEDPDPSWDAIWESAVQITEEGWNVEMRIPYSMLRFPQMDFQIWGIHFMRKIPRLGEHAEWPLILHTKRSNLVAGYGHMTNITGIEPKPNVQIRPYMNMQLKTRESASKPGSGVVNSSIDAGGNIKYGIGPNITLDATINPDFGQVESDPAVLNLTAFETFFPEKRPFFLEGFQNYRFDITVGEMFYSRRIGGQKPIIGAAKLTGRTAGGLSFGMLSATTGDHFSPSNNYGVARLSQQIGNYSSAGAILTAFDGPAITSSGRHQSLTGGTDWDLRFDNNRFGLEGFATFTHGNKASLSRDTETGIAGKIQFGKREGVWNGYGNLKVISNKFDPNDLGQLSRNNFIEAYGNINHEINRGDPFGPFQRVNANLSWGKRVSYDEGLNLNHHIDINSDWTLKTFQQIQLGGDIDITEGYDLYETRGLWPWAQPRNVELYGEFDTDERRPWKLSPEINYTFYEDGGKEYELTFGGSWNIGDKFSLSGDLNGAWERKVAAWVSNESFKGTDGDWMIGNQSLPPDELANSDFVSFDGAGLLESILSDLDPTMNNQYFVPVFGKRDTRSLDITLRTDVTFNPKLSLQTYGQLFFARGRYGDFSILKTRDSLAPFGAYPKRSAFALNSLQSNVVLRWEYRPGSTAYFVWTHSRSKRDRLNPLSPWGPSPYDRSIGKRIIDTFHIFPQNIFMVKINYTFLY